MENVNRSQDEQTRYADDSLLVTNESGEVDTSSHTTPDSRDAAENLGEQHAHASPGGISSSVVDDTSNVKTIGSEDEPLDQNRVYATHGELSYPASTSDHDTGREILDSQDE